MDMKLTKDADKMLCEIYAAYLERRERGATKQQARDFLAKDNWPKKYAEQWGSPDGLDTLRELRKAGFVRTVSFYGFRLETAAIAHMESRFEDKLSSVLEWISKFTSMLPGI